MSGDVKFTITPEGKKKLKTSKNIPVAHRYQLTKWGSSLIKHLQRVTLTSVLKVGSGALRRSLKMKVYARGSSYELDVGTKGSKYAAIHEFGGMIKAKRKQYLTIPLPGVKGWARNYPDAFVIKSKKGNLLIVERSGSGIKPLFVLRKSVTMPKRKWFSGAIAHKKADLKRKLSKAQIMKVAERI